MRQLEGVALRLKKNWPLVRSIICFAHVRYLSAAVQLMAQVLVI